MGRLFKKAYPLLNPLLPVGNANCFLKENDEPIDLRLKYHLEGIFDLAM